MSGHIAVNFHYVGMGSFPHPGIHGLDTVQFQKTLEGLGRAYDFISLEDIRAAVSGHRDLPERAGLVTLDDGLTCQYTHALPILDTLGIPAAFFALGCPYGDRRAASVHKLHYLRATRGDSAVLAVVTELADKGEIPHHPSEVDGDRASESYRYDDKDAARLKYFLNYFIPAEATERIIGTLFTRLDLEEHAFDTDMYMPIPALKALADRGWLGSHAWSHRPLARMSKDEAKKELISSRALLEDLTGTPIRAVSYPLGNPDAVNRSVADIAVEAGYTIGWSMERALNISCADPLLFARIDASDITKIDDLAVRSSYLADS
jgi:peptidoglycan/xylan/chitin deacetylase (PgdA/CDA1 family)